MKNFIFTLVLSGLLLFSQSVMAEIDSWEMKITPQFAFSKYNDSLVRDTMFDAGVFLAADYLDSGGLTLGYNYSHIEGKSGNQEHFDSLDENTFYLAGVMHSYPDKLPGKLSYRLDAYYVDDTTTVIETDIIPVTPSPMASVIATHNSGGGRMFNTSIYYSNTIITLNPILTFSSSGETYELELGYAYSDYRYGDSSVNDNQVHQLAPMYGFGFNEAYDWIQMRAYLIHLTDSSLSNGEEDFTSLEVKWIHWFKGAPLSLDNMGIEVLLGKRMLAVDPDAATLYSLSDQETGALAIYGQWDVSEATQFMLQLGYEQYEDLLVENDYSVIYTYFNFSHQW